MFISRPMQIENGFRQNECNSEGNVHVIFTCFNMFLQDAHMRPLWTGVHQDIEFDSTCGDSA